MADEWTTAQLGDVTDILTSFPFKSEHYVDNPSAPRLLRGDNVAQGVLEGYIRFRLVACYAAEIATVTNYDGAGPAAELAFGP